MTNVMALISPAKTLDFDTAAPVAEATHFRCADQAQALIQALKQKPVAEIKRMMKLSDNLAQLNAERYQQWQPVMTEQNSKQALFAFKGDVYTGLSAETLRLEQVASAQNSLRILSGLYGLLRPLDRIQPYRLEMGTALVTGQTNNLYQFWGDTITHLLNEDIQQNAVDVLLNLASTEYFKAVKPAQLLVPVVTPVFKDKKNGDYKIISFFAKKARGLMVRYMLDNPIQTLDELKAFNYAGYRFDRSLSSEHEWMFLRDSE